MGEWVFCFFLLVAPHMTLHTVSYDRRRMTLPLRGELVPHFLSSVQRCGLLFLLRLSVLSLNFNPSLFLS